MNKINPIEMEKLCYIILIWNKRSNFECVCIFVFSSSLKKKKKKKWKKKKKKKHKFKFFYLFKKEYTKRRR